MRIVAKIATAGAAGLSRFPIPNADIDECLDAAGRFDESKARAALDCEQIQVGSNDDRRVVAFTMEYLKQQRSVVERLASDITRSGECAASVTDERGFRTEAVTRGDHLCERNMKKNRIAYVRTDVTGCRDGIHAKLSVMNPRNAMGCAGMFAHDYAVMCARILIYLRENITTAKITLIEGDGAEGIYAEAGAMNRRDDLAKLRASCDRLHNGYCSPCNPTCPLYTNGKCKDPAKEENE